MYRLSSFATDHPGGVEALLECAGTDGTETYDYAGHSEGAKGTLERFLVGDLEGHVGSQVEPGPKSTSMSTTQPPNVKAIAKPWIWLLLLAAVGLFGLTGWRSLTTGETPMGFSRGDAFSLGSPLTAFWAGVLLASSVSCIGLGYVYDQFGKSLEHTKEPFSYPAVIPRPVHVVR